jgi:hypothetical protein
MSSRFRHISVVGRLPGGNHPQGAVQFECEYRFGRHANGATLRQNLSECSGARAGTRSYSCTLSAASNRTDLLKFKSGVRKIPFQEQE